MYRSAFLIVSALLSLLPTMHAAQSKRPDLPFFDWNACPFEGCVYRQWTARKPVVVYDTWKRTRQPLTSLAAGDKALAVTGVVITFKPGVIRMDRDHTVTQWPTYGDRITYTLKRGDIILTYAYRGEGSWAVWFNGTYLPSFEIPPARRLDGQDCRPIECAATYTDLGKKEWWAKVKLKSGRTGWINMDAAEFDGVDLLG
jgi:hypothetical protein